MLLFLAGKIESDLDVATFDIWRNKSTSGIFCQDDQERFQSILQSAYKTAQRQGEGHIKRLTAVTQKFKHVEWLNERQNSAWFRCYEWTIKLLSSGCGFVCRTANTLQLKCLRQGPEQGADFTCDNVWNLKPSNCRFLARYNLPFARTWCSMLAASLSEILIDNTFLPFARLGNCQSTKALFIFALCFHPRFGNCILGKSSILVGVLKSQVEIQGSKKVNLHPVECA